jgi:hypothetical protein
MSIPQLIREYWGLYAESRQHCLPLTLALTFDGGPPAALAESVARHVTLQCTWPRLVTLDLSMAKLPLPSVHLERVAQSTVTRGANVRMHVHARFTEACRSTAIYPVSSSHKYAVPGGGAGRVLRARGSELRGPAVTVPRHCALQAALPALSLVPDAARSWIGGAEGVGHGRCCVA